MSDYCHICGRTIHAEPKCECHEEMIALTAKLQAAEEQLIVTEKDAKLWKADALAAESRAEAAEALIAELEEDNAICREAIADCVDMLNDWEDTHYTDDHEDGCIRATERKLSEAIGKACPRLLYEPEEGRKYYGLRWKELVTERDAALARIAELERLHRQDQDAIEFNGEQGQHDQHLIAALRAKLQAAEAEAQRLREALERIAKNHEECEDGWYSCPAHPDYIGPDKSKDCNCWAGVAREALGGEVKP